MSVLQRRGAFVLIFSLWVLGFLTVVAVGVAAGIRQKIVLLEKLEQRGRDKFLLEAAVKHAASYIAQQKANAAEFYSVQLKMDLHHNPQVFGRFQMGQAFASIGYAMPYAQEQYGVVDEERKINLNMTTVHVLSRLIERVIGLKADAARRMAESILDWRQFGESQIKGFFSDGYYTALEFPYPKKDADYEVLDELLLVKDVTKPIYERLINYVTIYGEGRVNFNTASREVLYALGLEEELINKVLEVRQGRDMQEGTPDDHVFIKPFDITSDIKARIKLHPDETRALDGLNQQHLLTTNASFFNINASVQLGGQMSQKTVRVVFSQRENRIVYWKER